MCVNGVGGVGGYGGLLCTEHIVIVINLEKCPCTIMRCCHRDKGFFIEGRFSAYI